MAAERLPMRKIKDILRQTWLLQRSHRQIAARDPSAVAHFPTGFNEHLYSVACIAVRLCVAVVPVPGVFVPHLVG